MKTSTLKMRKLQRSSIVSPGRGWRIVPLFLGQGDEGATGHEDYEDHSRNPQKGCIKSRLAHSGKHMEKKLPMSLITQIEVEK